MPARPAGRYELLLDTMLQGVVFKDASGHILSVNPAGERILGVTQAELLSQTSEGREDATIREDGSPFPGTEHPSTLALRSGREQHGIVMGVFNSREQGYRWISISAVPLFHPGESTPYQVYTLFDDITGWRRADASLREGKARRAIERDHALDEHEAQLRAAQRLAKVGSWFWTIGSDAYGWSEELYRIAGRDAVAPPPTQEEFSALLGQEGNERLAKALNRAVELGEAAELQLELVRPDGKRCCTVTRVEALRDDHGRIVALLGTVQDVTELRKQEEQLRQSQKLEGIGRLAGGIAHDFNNLLTAILGYGGELLEGLPEPGPLQDAAREIELAARRAAALTRQLLTFSRKQVVEPRVLDLNEIVAGIEKMLRRLIGEDVELAVHAAPALGRVKADPGQLEQVLVNLAVNARDAMPEGGRLTIEVSDVELSVEQARLQAGASPGPYVRLAVSDTGSGMGAEVRSHLFEPFFTTKEQGRGTGLGLSTVYGIVRQAGGYVTVCSEVGQGSVFKVYLPRTDEPRGAVEGLGAAGLPVHEAGDVLLVEDDEQVRTLTGRTLRHLGLTVLEARDGEEALRVVAGKNVDLVVTDTVMPHMGGEELAARIRAERPGTKVLLVSGYTERGGALQGALVEGTAFLQKPYTPAALALKIRDLLHPRRTEA